MRLAPRTFAALASGFVASVLVIAASGCGKKDVGTVSTIISKVGISPNASPSPLGRSANRVDLDAQGGGEGQLHQTISGWTVSNGTVGGTVERTEATSGNFEVNGGIYVQ